MLLKLMYSVNQGINIIDHSKEGCGKSVDLIVRGINSFRDIIGVDFELIDSDEGSSEIVNLLEGQRYELTPSSNVFLPRNPLITPENGPYRESVSLILFGPRAVEFSRKKIYPNKEHMLTA